MTHTQFANLLKAFATPRRVKIVKLLLKSSTPLTGTYLCAQTGLDDGRISSNLKVLTDVGLVIKQHSGRYTLFSINRPVLREIRRFWNLKPKE